MYLKTYVFQYHFARKCYSKRAFYQVRFLLLLDFTDYSLFPLLVYVNFKGHLFTYRFAGNLVPDISAPELFLIEG